MYIQCTCVCTRSLSLSPSPPSFPLSFPPLPLPLLTPQGRIQKRERKVVDYDLRRRELEQAKSKAKVNDQKLQQAEETHTQAKQLYDELTDDLYEELPTFYDRCVWRFVSVFSVVFSVRNRISSSNRSLLPSPLPRLLPSQSNSILCSDISEHCCL